MKAKWKEILRNNFRKWEDLADFLELDEKKRDQILTTSSFPLNLPKRLAEKIEKNNLSDPILRQFLPTQEEKIAKSGFVKDPLSEQNYKKSSKMLQKYQGRALLLASSACAMHCRYCFRRHFPYEDDRFSFDKEVAQIKENPSLFEIILSGGDPLSLDDKKLHTLFLALEDIEHVRFIRFHTRFPIGIPERIDSSFLSLIDNSSKSFLFVLHVNHPKELGDDLLFHLRSIQERGIPILAQTVLLQGVNDNLSTLKELALGLISCGIIPYYLHQLDPVEGGAHFHTNKERGLMLMEEFKKEMPGYCHFRYVEEIPGKAHKTEIAKTTFSLRT